MPTPPGTHGFLRASAQSIYLPATGARHLATEDHVEDNFCLSSPLPSCWICRGQDGFIGIGYQREDVVLSRLPGWEEHSYGYHGDDGHCFAGKRFLVSSPVRMPPSVIFC